MADDGYLESIISKYQSLIRLNSLKALSEGGVYELIGRLTVEFEDSAKGLDGRVDDFLEYYKDNRQTSSEWTASYESLFQVYTEIVRDYHTRDE